MDNRKIGVFDSGMGGISTLIQLKKMMPNEDFIYYGDSANAPYGTKTSDEILELTLNVAKKLISKNVKAIVVACNTATSVAIETLRSRYPDIVVIGVEPALKLAVDAGSANIAVMATETTLREKKFKELSKNYASDCTVHNLVCSELVRIAEADKLDDIDLCKNQLKKYFGAIEDNIDSVVLGCTHFLFYKKYIREILGESCFIIDGNLGTARHLKNKLKEIDSLSGKDEIGDVEFLNSQSNIGTDGVNKLDLSKKIYNMFY